MSALSSLYLMAVLLCGTPAVERPVLRMEVGHPLISFSSTRVWLIYRWRERVDLAADTPVVASVTCRGQKCQIAAVMAGNRGAEGTRWLNGRVFGVADDGSALLMLDPSPFPVSEKVHDALTLEKDVTKFVEVTYDVASDGRLVATRLRPAGTARRRPLTWK